MHQPDTAPRPSLYYRYQVFPFVRPSEMEGEPARHRVAIVGAGPIGLLAAIDLARFGVPSVVIESEAQVSHGSRAIVLTRRSLEILQQAGVIEAFLAKGLPWSHGRSFYRGQEVYRMVMPHDEDDRFLPGLNIQQQYIEEFLVDAAMKSGLVEIRWQSSVTSVAQDADGVRLGVETPDGAYDLAADWVVAADGGRSVIRRLLGLRFEGQSFPGNFVIADIKAEIDRPTERLCYFDPPWNPGNNVLVHREPDGIWRLDFRLPDNETAEEALEETRLSSRINAILEMIGAPGPWQLDWATVYSANTLTLPDYVSGRVIFTGDAAHLLPIFGVRGANTGFQDADNLAWKLAYVVQGWAPPALLASYSHERVAAAREICAEGGRSTRFMTPPTRGYRLLRDAVLSLSLSQQFPKNLLHWRTSRPHDYHDSPLNSPAAENSEASGGLRPGEPLRNVKLGTGDYLFDHLGTGFHLLAILPDGDAAPLEALSKLAQEVDGPFELVAVVPEAAHRFSDLATTVIADPAGRVAGKYEAGGRAFYLVRPDLHVAARWTAPATADVMRALKTARGYAGDKS